LTATRSANYAQAGSSVLSDSPRVSHDAEASACLDVPESELRRSPLESRHVIAVEPVHEVSPQKGRPARLLGARVYLLASPGLTREWLGHLLECHVARHATASSASRDPLTVDGATIELIDTTNGFGVSITSADWEKAERILRRSRALRM
jgi:hypothetical protein